MKKNFDRTLTFLLILVVQITFAQERTISGIVSDKTGVLPWVHILVLDTKKGTYTDFEGKYSIKVKKGNILIFSFQGMKTVQKTVGNANTINVAMVESKNVLDEVVVLGYGSRRRNELTGSSVQIKSDKIAEIPVASINQVLQGKVAGLSISASSGTPGSLQDIRIRGISSITSENSPLYVVDGVPIINQNISGGVDANGDAVTSTFTSLSSFDPADVASITVLKDASATAAYGARGANGVIVITTKSGKLGKTTYNFSSAIGFANDAIEGLSVLNPKEITALGNEALVNSGKFKTLKEAQDYEWTQEAFGVNGNTIPNPNWTDVIANKDAIQKKYNFSASGGDESSKFHASLGYLSAEATVIGTDFERINGLFSYLKNLNKKLTFSTKATVSNAIQNGFLEANAYFSNPRAAKYFMSPLSGQPYNQDGSININLKGNTPNPLYIMSHNMSRNSFVRTINNSSLKWKVLENLALKSNFSIDYLVRDYKGYNNRIYGDGRDTNGTGYQRNYQNVNYVWQNSANYNWRINAAHKIDFTALAEYQQNNERYLSAEGQQYATDGLTSLDIAGKPRDVGSSDYDWKSISYLMMANYNFSGKYFVDLTYRREGSSRFNTNHRFGNFWSAGVAWNIYKEAFFSSLTKVIDNFRFRASYGINGNVNLGLNRYQGLLGYSENYAGAGVSYPSQLPNDNLSWEKNKLLDVGAEFGFFDNRITGSFSYFNRETYDLLLNVPLSRTTGHNNILKNVGKMRNKGVEATLNFEIVSTDNFNFSVGGNIATVANKVEELAKNALGKTIEITTDARKVAEGKPVYSWFIRKYAGVEPSTGEATWWKETPVIDTNTGKPLLDSNGKEQTVTVRTNKYSEAKRYFVGGSALPTLTGGFNAHIDYKGFFLDASVYFATGHKVFDDSAEYTHQGGLYNFTSNGNGVKSLLNRWQKPGDITRVPKVLWDNNQDRSSASTRFLYDGDYARLKDLTFGYNFGKEIIKRTFLSAVRLYVKGTNLLTWVKDDNLKQDPEIAADGIIGLTTPPMKTVTFGVNLKF